MADLGWMGIMIPEEYDGVDGSFVDLAILQESAGEACLPGPFFSTVVLGGLTILTAGTAEQKKKWLPKISAGKIILSLATTEAESGYETTDIKTEAVKSHNDYVINGTKLFVENAHLADSIICAAEVENAGTADDALTLFLIDGKSKGIECTCLKTLAFDKQCEVHFHDVRVPQEHIIGGIGQGGRILEDIHMKATVLKCAELVGIMQAVLNRTVAYAKERKQFKRPIGSFQAIQHQCTDMLIDVDSSRFITYQTAWKVSQGLPCQLDIAMAKAWTSKAAARVSRLGHAIHGAISYTEEHDMHLYYRRAKACEIAFGDTDFHLQKVARGMGL
jgi:alkylation response protein AidB-like acyl-CoA dehydrogenase